MKDLGKYLVIGLGGFLGANARYLLDGWVQDRWGTAFPYGTLVINVSGSFVLALFYTFALEFTWSDTWRLLIAVGFLGAYTTFSTFTYESLRLAVEGGRERALLNLVGSVLVGFAAAYLGLVVGRLLLQIRHHS